MGRLADQSLLAHHRGDFHRAITLAREGIAAGEGDRARIRLALYVAELGRTEEARSLLLESGNGDWLAEVVRALLASRDGDGPTAIAHAERAAELATGGGRCWALSVLAGIEDNYFAFGLARRHALEAQSCAEKAGDNRAKAYALIVLSRAHRHEGEHDEAIAIAQLALEAAEAAEDSQAIWRANLQEALGLLAAGRAGEALEAADDCLLFAEQFGPRFTMKAAYASISAHCMERQYHDIPQRVYEELARPAAASTPEALVLPFLEAEALAAMNAPASRVAAALEAANEHKLNSELLAQARACLARAIDQTANDEARELLRRRQRKLNALAGS